jgi:hypothetical protein
MRHIPISPQTFYKDSAIDCFRKGGRKGEGFHHNFFFANPIYQIYLTASAKGLPCLLLFQINFDRLGTTFLWFNP